MNKNMHFHQLFVVIRSLSEIEQEEILPATGVSFSTRGTAYVGATSFAEFFLLFFFDFCFSSAPDPGEPAISGSSIVPKYTRLRRFPSINWEN